ncbi:hypothetical protein E3Q18_04260 [Wallemia mellicola]|nr:hypothetical protein E3Q18_04260 [Wallemia mellicola]TIC07426.1 hypothetical protein E3Q14_04274 [Wallemia mellicola]TIC23966.1 hypothetical protein E3Q10_04207 [Wallemia mellicola]
MAVEYRNKLQSLAKNVQFVMTLYLSPSLTPEEIRKAAANGITGVKSYPRGVTTNSDGGIESYEVYYPVFEAMEQENMVLNLHGEVPSSEETGVTVLNAEERFLPQLDKLARSFPKLRIVVEHATTKAAVEKVKSLPDNVGCSITPHHLQLIVDDWAGQGFNFCKPVAKYWEDRNALRDVIREGHPRFFLGSDSAPHPRANKLNKAPRFIAETQESVPACACAAGLFTSAILIPLCAHLLESFGALDKLEGKPVKLVKEDNVVPIEYTKGDNIVVPFMAANFDKFNFQLEKYAKQELGLKLDRDGPYCARGHPKSRLPERYTLEDADPPPVPDEELGPPPGYMGYSYERGPWESRRFGAGFGGEPGQGIAHGIGPGGVSHGPGEPFIRNVNQKPRDNQNAQVRRGLENILCFKCGQHGHYANQCPNKIAAGPTVIFSDMNSVLEDERNAHSEIDQYEDYLVELFLDVAKGQKKQMAQKHQMSKVTDRMLERREFLKNSYNSAEREQELTIIGTSQVADDLNLFYERLSSIKDYHRKNPNAPVDGFRYELDGFRDELDREVISSLFSGEETYGKYLDLHISHEQYVNLKGIPKRLNYLQYLDEFEQVEDLPKQVKAQSSYGEYLNTLVTYLESFLQRSRPFDDYSAIQLETLAKFDESWQAGTVPGWPKEESNDESKGIWDPVMQRYYANQNVYNNVKKSKKYQNALKRLESSGEKVAENGDAPASDKAAELRRSKDKTLASQEALLRLYATILAGVRKETKAEIERKSALTAREREQELEEAQYEEFTSNPIEEVVQEEKDDEGKIYNPLKLPLGWDGKPIPFWLFKLHGLGVEYECEICSGKVYNGRKNFEKHFQEGTHAYGMRALGLPNTKHFHEITKIADALALAEKLKIQGRQETQANATVEEIEDDQGNVYDMKTYNQLKKQGLL